MNNNREELLEELEIDTDGDRIMGYITRNVQNAIINDFEEWLETAKIGDTYYYSDFKYTLKEIN